MSIEDSDQDRDRGIIVDAIKKNIYNSMCLRAYYSIM